MEIRISNRKIGNIRLDATIQENHTSELKITDNPIESGATISDHCYLAPKQITIKGVIVDYEPPNIDISLPSNLPFKSGVDKLLSVAPPVIVDIPSITQKAKQVFAEFKSVSKLLSKNSDVLAPYLPNFENDVDGINSGRISEFYGKFLQLQRKGEVITINTGAKQYKNMLVTMVSLSQTNDRVGEFDITAREVFISELATFGIKSSVASGKNAVGRAFGGIAEANHKNTQPNPKQLPRSFLNRIFGD